MKTMRSFDKPKVRGVILPTSRWSSICLIPVQLPRKPLRFPHKFQQEKKIGELKSGKLPIPEDHGNMSLHLGLDLGTSLIIRDTLFGS
jgi:hypothetical protein